MRKLFRMKYEPCSGRCYAWEDVINMEELGIDVKSASVLLDRIIKIHEPVCGNENLAYALDYDENLKIFVASFIHYGSLDLFADQKALGALSKLIDAALLYYNTEEYKTLTKEKPGKGHDVCEHGEDYDLRRFAMKFSGLSKEDQDKIIQESV